MPSSPPNNAETWIDAAVELLGRDGRAGFVRVQGTSMLPTLEPGFTVQVEFGVGSLRAGDIILFRQSGILVVHRFLARVRSRRAGSCLRTRGDGAPALDPPVRESGVLGRVRAVGRRDGWRSLDGRRARAYAFGVALHGHSWAAAAVAAGWADRVLTKLRLPGVARSVVVRIDHGLLRIVHSVLFGLAHRRIEAPPVRITAD